MCVPDIMAIAAAATGDQDLLISQMQAEVVKHCDLMNDRIAILDTPPDYGPTDAKDFRLNMAFDSKQAALYYPWLEVTDPLTNLPLLVPPCGHVAGVWAYTDTTRGVHKAPANEAIRGITGLGYAVTGGAQQELNRLGVNCIRKFPGRGIRVWGARTISSDPEWRYVNVRRLFNFISDSIMQGTQWVVQCDKETNPPALIDAGQVTTKIGIAPVKPAEFVVFQISQYSAGGEAA